MRLRCLDCGKAFHCEPSRSRKFCSTACYNRYRHRQRMSGGFQWRKRAMAHAKHHRDVAITVALKLRGAPVWERLSILDDLQREGLEVRSELRERYKRMTKKRRRSLERLYKELVREGRRWLGGRVM